MAFSAASLVAASQTVPAWVSVCTKVAPFTSITLVMAPLPTVQKFVKERTVSNLPALPYSSMIVNAFVWVMYGLLKADSKIWLPNSIGVVLGSYYFLQYKKYCYKNANNLPGTIDQHIFGMGGMIAFTILASTVFSKSLSAAIVGKVGVLLCILMFASPLSALKNVLETRSAKSIPLPFTIACLVNCVLWSVAGVIKMRDFNVYFPNILGLTSSVAQLVLKLMYGDGEKSGMSLPL